MALAAAFSAAAQTTENLVIEETNGNKTTLATSRIAGVLFEDAPSYTKAEYMLSASYATMGSNGVYTIELGTDEPDEYGQPSTVGGMQASQRAKTVSPSIFSWTEPWTYAMPPTGSMTSAWR